MRKKKTSFKDLIKKYKKKLYLECEYEINPRKNIEFSSGLEVFQKRHINHNEHKRNKFKKKGRRGENGKIFGENRESSRKNKGRSRSGPKISFHKRERGKAEKNNEKKIKKIKQIPQNSNPKKEHKIQEKSIPNSSKMFFEKKKLKVLKDKRVYYEPIDAYFSSIFESVKQLSQHFEIESILKAFKWQHFEVFLSQALEHYGYFAKRTFRFKVRNKRYEVDVIGRNCQEILFIDAKHWSNKTASPSALMNVAQEQKERAKALVISPEVCGRILQDLSYKPRRTFKAFKVYPIIVVSSALPKNRIVNGVPILSFHRFNEFLNNFHALRGTLRPISFKKATFQKKLG